MHVIDINCDQSNGTARILFTSGSTGEPKGLKEAKALLDEHGN